MTVEALLEESSQIDKFCLRQVEQNYLSGDGGDSATESSNKCPNKKNKTNKHKSSNNSKQAAAASKSTTKIEVNINDGDKNDDDVVCDIVKARQNIQMSLASAGCVAGAQGNNKALESRVIKLESTVTQLENEIKNLTNLLSKLTAQCNNQSPIVKSVCPPKPTSKVAAAADDDDDDVDLFGSDEDEAANELRQKRLDEYAQKKAKKPGVIAKSSVVLDIKPWDDETNMEEMQRLVRSVQMDGLVWGASKYVPLAYGIKKLQIVCVIEDDKVSVEELGEKLQEFEDYVQSVDVAAFNKI